MSEDIGFSPNSACCWIRSTTLHDESASCSDTGSVTWIYVGRADGILLL